MTKSYPHTDANTRLNTKVDKYIVIVELIINAKLKRHGETNTELRLSGKSEIEIQ